jgi:hypothetical protein
MSNKYSNPKGTRFFFGKGALLLSPRCQAQLIRFVQRIFRVLVTLGALVLCTVVVSLCFLHCTNLYIMLWIWGYKNAMDYHQLWVGV